MSRTDTPAALRALAAEIESHPAPSQETASALVWVQSRLLGIAMELDAPERAPTPAGPVCARCRRDVATELRRQAFMN